MALKARTAAEFAVIEQRAQQMHRDYRAAAKALGERTRHDHGWKACHAKRYFWQRAAAQLRKAYASGGVIEFSDILAKPEAIEASKRLLRECTKITDHVFMPKAYAEVAANQYGSELAADITYCEICNRPSEAHSV